MSTATPSSTSNADAPPNEEQLRKSLSNALKTLTRREPLDPKYSRLLTNGLVTSRRPVLPKDKFYRRVGSRLRERVEGFMKMTEGKDPFDRISQRQPLEENQMRAALTLREAKEHEQQPLLDATLSAVPHRNGMDEMARKRHFEGIALTLQTEKKKTPMPPIRARSPTVAEQTESARIQADLERRRQNAKTKEDARQAKEHEERKKREEEMQRKRQKAAETPQQQLKKIYQPIFKKLWDMEFSNLNSMNPFRLVIDRGNCASMGAPDYFDVIDIPVSNLNSNRKCGFLLPSAIGSL